MVTFDNLRITALGLYSLTAVLITLGYVRCQDLKKTFDSPDQLVMVIRAPPETQMQVSEPSKVQAVNWLSFLKHVYVEVEIFHMTVCICLHVSRVTRCHWRARGVQSMSSSVQKTAPASAVLWLEAAHQNPMLTPPWSRLPHSPQTNLKPERRQPALKWVCRHQRLRHPQQQPPPSRTPHQWC